ncbi:MAG TPA: DUF1345 domain-containing protein [Phenylobacterium sp.]|nr:DUF1345 domain-containing protein [Phenylobacterium sp.]
MRPGTPQHRGYWRFGLNTFASRPRLAIAMGAGLAVSVACALLLHLRPSALAIAGWDTFCLVFLALVWGFLSGQGPDGIRAASAQQDQGQAMILALVLTACLASLAATGIELSLAKSEQGIFRAFHVTVAVVTVAVSWLVVQVVLALHYAHEYYARDPLTGRDFGGLAFPACPEPDYWDFLHFSIVIGAAAQTADIAFTDQRLRRLGTVHSLIAFIFNTLILALSINLAASLF